MMLLWTLAACIASADEPAPRVACIAIALNTGLNPENAAKSWAVALPEGWEPVGGGGNPATVVACKAR